MTRGPAFLGAIALLVLPAPLAAQILTGTPITIPDEPTPTGPGTMIYDGMPPRGYADAGTYTVVFASDISAFCNAPRGYQARGCVRHTAKGLPMIIVESPLRRALAGDFYARLLLHEMAHAQGWPADHPMVEPKK